MLILGVNLCNFFVGHLFLCKQTWNSKKVAELGHIGSNYKILLRQIAFYPCNILFSFYAQKHSYREKQNNM